MEARKQLSVKSFTLKQLLTTPELKLPLIIAIVCQVAQQWSGINAVSHIKFSDLNIVSSELSHDKLKHLSIQTQTPSYYCHSMSSRPAVVWDQCCKLKYRPRQCMVYFNYHTVKKTTRISGQTERRTCI